MHWPLHKLEGTKQCMKLKSWICSEWTWPGSDQLCSLLASIQSRLLRIRKPLRHLLSSVDLKERNPQGKTSLSESNHQGGMLWKKIIMFNEVQIFEVMELIFSEQLNKCVPLKGIWFGKIQRTTSQPRTALRGGRNKQDFRTLRGLERLVGSSCFEASGRSCEQLSRQVEPLCYSREKCG